MQKRMINTCLTIDSKADSLHQFWGLIFFQWMLVNDDYMNKMLISIKKIDPKILHFVFVNYIR